MAAGQVKQLLEDGDYRSLRAGWSELFPHLPPPQSDAAAEISLHMARTQSQAVATRARLYSHAWLRERSIPSQLPDNLKQQADRTYPRKVSAVGIAVEPSADWLRPVAKEVHGAMVSAAEDVYANGDQDRPGLLRGRILEARDTARSKLLGRV